MLVEPGGEGAVVLLQSLNDLGVVDGGLDLEAVADDAGIVQQALAVGGEVAGHGGDVEIVVRPTKVFLLLQNGEPREPRLVDFQYQALEQRRVVLERKTVLGVVVGAVPGVVDGCGAIRAHGLSLVDGGRWSGRRA